MNLASFCQKACWEQSTVVLTADRNLLACSEHDGQEVEALITFKTLKTGSMPDRLTDVMPAPGG
jgi:hypothetical protein